MARLTVAGNGPDHDELKARFAREKISGDVEFIGGLPQAKVSELLAQHDVFVLTSRFEGCPNGLLEAMAAGCACVAANIRNSVSNIIDDGRDGLLFRVGDAGELVAAIIKLSGDAALRATLGHAARAKIESRFEISLTAREYADVIGQSVVSKSRRSRPLGLDRFHVPRNFRPHWASWLPVPVKAWLRTMFERRGRAI